MSKWSAEICLLGMSIWKRCNVNTSKSAQTVLVWFLCTVQASLVTYVTKSWGLNHPLISACFNLPCQEIRGALQPHDITQTCCSTDIGFTRQKFCVVHRVFHGGSLLSVRQHTWRVPRQPVDPAFSPIITAGARFCEVTGRKQKTCELKSYHACSKRSYKSECTLAWIARTLLPNKCQSVGLKEQSKEQSSCNSSCFSLCSKNPILGAVVPHWIRSSLDARPPPQTGSIDGVGACSDGAMWSHGLLKILDACLAHGFWNSNALCRDLEPQPLLFTSFTLWLPLENAEFFVIPWLPQYLSKLRAPTWGDKCGANISWLPQNVNRSSSKTMKYLKNYQAPSSTLTSQI